MLPPQRRGAAYFEMPPKDRAQVWGGSALFQGATTSPDPNAVTVVDVVQERPEGWALYLDSGTFCRAQVIVGTSQTSATYTYDVGPGRMTIPIFGQTVRVSLQETAVPLDNSAPYATQRPVRVVLAWQTATQTPTAPQNAFFDSIGLGLEKDFAPYACARTLVWNRDTSTGNVTVRLSTTNTLPGSAFTATIATVLPGQTFEIAWSGGIRVSCAAGARANIARLVL